MAEEATSRLVVIGFDNEFEADGMLQKLEEWQEQGLIELDDAVGARRGATEHVDFKQTRKLTGKYAKRGAGAGLLAGWLVGGPIGGLAAGAAVGAIWGGAKDIGIDDKFIHETSGWLKPHSSMVFLLVKSAKGEELLPKLKSFEDAHVLSAALDPEAEQRLRSAIEKKSY
jgi:uncharacterized membrane protein